MSRKPKISKICLCMKLLSIDFMFHVFMFLVGEQNEQIFREKHLEKKGGGV